MHNTQRVHNEEWVTLNAYNTVSIFSRELFLQIALKRLSYDVASESESTPCNKIDKPLVVYIFTGNVITSITALRT